MIVCGIDPGLFGGLAFLDHDGKILHVAVMPIVGKPASIDAGELAKLLRDHRPDRVLLEKVGAMPGQGVTSMFTFGVGFGVVKGAAAALGLPLELVPPKTWQKGLGSIGAGDDPKKRTLAYVKLRWPDVPLIPARCRVAHGGIVDALAIAEWGRVRACLASRVG